MKIVKRVIRIKTARPERIGTSPYAAVTAARLETVSPARRQRQRQPQHQRRLAEACSSPVMGLPVVKDFLAPKGEGVARRRWWTIVTARLVK